MYAVIVNVSVLAYLNDGLDLSNEARTIKRHGIKLQITFFLALLQLP